MKKFIYIFLFSTISALAIMSCTEEEVSPKTETELTTGGGTDPGKI